MEFLHGFAARRRIQILEERKSRCIHIHRYRESTRLMHHLHLLTDRLDVPRLHSRNAESASLPDCLCGSDHYVAICAVAGECSDTKFRTRRNQYIIIGNVV